MSFWEILNTIIIKPLELLFEFIFSMSYSIIPNPAVCLIIMSVSVNLLILPLYRRADAIQMEAREKEDKIRPVTDHIKKYFKGDEKVMMLQSYYKEMHYHPLSSLKSLTSLLLQIPFFMAAYGFLSHLALLDGWKMGWIDNLLEPDGLLVIGSLSINVLPILMTVINIISSEIYTRGQPFKSKIVLYLSAAIFLVLLYNSPSGLVFYWTLNNLFSLVKNVISRMKDPALIFKIICSVMGLTLGITGFLLYSDGKSDKKVFLLTVGMILMLPLLSALFVKLIKKNGDAKKVTPGSLFWIGSSYMAVLTGILIPSDVISSCTEDFLGSINALDPTHYIIYSACVSFGFFVLWLGVFYLLMDRDTRRVFTLMAVCVSFVSTLDYMVFGMDKKGMMNAELGFDRWIEPDSFLKLISLVSALSIIVLMILIARFSMKPFVIIVSAGLMSIAILCGINLVRIHNDYNEYVRIMANTQTPDVKISKNGKNVVVLMMDRAIGALVPYIFNEKPELYEAFDGFTYYPNTISHGIYTNFGAPELYGGYEYNTTSMNLRSDEKLKDKHNEALLLMPVVFSENGYESVTIDPPYADYRVVGDYTIFDGYEHIHAYRAKELYNPYWEDAFVQQKAVRERNFFCYSLFRIALPLYREILYDEGRYNSVERSKDGSETGEYSFPQYRYGISAAKGVLNTFMDSYTALEAMTSFTTIVDDSSDYFVMMDNTTPHNFMLLQEPDYTVAEVVDNTAYDEANTDRFTVNGRTISINNWYQMGLYHTNAAMYRSLAKWFSYLKENGAWDNTRIIIVADHGYETGYYSDLIYQETGFDTEYANPVLMVKDFNSTGFVTSDEFMTNADTPTLAMSGVIDDPVNPFTGNPINNDDKYSGPQNVLASYSWWITDREATQFEPGEWYTVHDNIFDINNWEYQGYH
ncbi:MAG: YidC/Oxa1 family membrane protein insertase [Saccharofermentans sp.]|nr:YidC/Oxa1 family membrane protein insertase [Saccharofermentans sp.]